MNYDKIDSHVVLIVNVQKKRSYVYFVSESHKEKSLYIGH